MGGRGEQTPRKKGKNADGTENKHVTIYSQRGERKFEYDTVKNEKNKEKHGIDFEDAQKLWDDEDLYEFDLKFIDEDRLGNVARMNGKHYTAVTTIRGEG